MLLQLGKAIFATDTATEAQGIMSFNLAQRTLQLVKPLSSVRKIRLFSWV